MTTKEHVDSFDDIYSRLGDLNLAGIRFPLVDIDAFRWNRGPWNDAYYNYHYRRFTCHILSRLALRENQAILIVGCGFGLDEKNIRSLSGGAELWSVDISRHMVRLAAASGSPSRFALALAENLPFPDRCFDRVLSREVIEHVISPEKMLKEIHRVLKPGGIALVTTENEESLAPSNYYDSNIWPRMADLFGVPLVELPYKDSAPSVREMKAMAADANLELVEHIFDGALYKHLVELSRCLKSKMATTAHFFSCLENNRAVAPIFCDQVKYVLRKSADHGTGINAAGYACAHCRGPLTDRLTRWSCTVCGSNYMANDGIPDFLQELVFVETELADAPEPEPKKPAKAARIVLSGLSRVLRNVYSFTYLLAAVLAAAFAKKNRKRPSGLLGDDDPYQVYLKL